MHRLLVVDDEPIIADGLCEIFQNMQGADLDVCKANSAREALEWLRRTRVDIVISDIRMPEMDGLQLLTEIRHNWPECHVIFLTGYSDFNSLYLASQYKVAYILKSDGYSRLIATVKESIGGIEEQLDIRRRLDEASTQLGFNRRLILRDILSHGGEKPPDANSVGTGLPLDLKQELLMIVGRCAPADNSVKPVYGAAETVFAALGQFFEKYMNMIYTLDHEGNMVCLLQKKSGLDSASCGQPALFVRETLETVQQAIYRTTGMEATFAVSGTTFPWEELLKRYRDLCMLAEHFSDTSSGAIVTEQNLGAVYAFAEGEGMPAALDYDFFQSMRIYLEAGRQEEFTEGFSRLSAFLRAARGKRNIMAAGAYMSMASMLISHINRLGLTARVDASVRLDRMMDMDRFTDWSEAAELLGNLAVAVFGIRSLNRQKRTASVVDKVKRYIRENVSGDLTLVHLADIVHFNPQYLSKLFKDTEGINLIDYISLARMEKAKQMLVNPACKVQDVALAVGYSNTANFCRFFRKHTGVPPNEYRDK